MRLDRDGNVADLSDDESGEPLTSAPLDALQLEPAPGNVARRIALPDGWLFETDDTRAADFLPERKGHGMLRAAEHLHPRLVLLVVAALAWVWVVWRYGLDLMVGVAIALTPSYVPDLIDGATVRSLDVLMAEPSQLSSAEQAEQQDIFDQMLTVLPDDRRDDYQLLFRDVPGMGPNAFAMPGGTIVLTDAIIRDFGDTPDLIAAVIGHEMGHVEEQHGLRQVYRSLSIFVLVALIAGDIGPILEEIALEGQVLLSLSYSREHELEADQYGLDLSAAAGFDPAALKTFFEAIEQYDGSADWYSTHPLSSERIRRIDDWLAEQG